MSRHPNVRTGRTTKLGTVAVIAALAVALLGGCMSVPALSDPVPQSPGTPQKTITELLTQWEKLTKDAMAATGDTEGWYRGAIIDGVLWDPKDEWVHLSPCWTVGSKNAHQLESTVAHEVFEHDPHPIADRLTAYWESEGFTVRRTIDWTDPTGGQSVVLSADRPDGVSYGLTATNEQVSIDVSTECSTHSSIDDWVEAGIQKRLDDTLGPTATPTPTPTSASSAGQPRADAPSDPVPDHSDLFRRYLEDDSPATADGQPAADDDGWVW
jgi:hypothetical protein